MYIGDETFICIQETGVYRIFFNTGDVNMEILSTSCFLMSNDLQLSFYKEVMFKLFSLVQTIWETNFTFDPNGKLLYDRSRGETSILEFS